MPLDLSFIDSMQIADEEKAKLRAKLQEVDQTTQQYAAQAQQYQQYARQYAAQAQQANHVAWQWYNRANQTPQQSPTPQQDAQQQAALAARKSIIKSYGDGEISYEQAVAGLREIDEDLSKVYSEVSQIRSTLPAVNAQMRQRDLYYQNIIGGLKRDLEQTRAQQADLFPLILEATRYQAEHPNRDIRKVFQTVKERGINRWDEAVAATFGGDDQESYINSEVEKRLNERLKERETVPSEGGMPAVPRMIFRREKKQRQDQQRVPRSNADVADAVMQVLTKHEAA